MKITIDECYELEGDYQNQFLGVEVFPRPKYQKLRLSKRTINSVHYTDVYILEPLHYYYATLNEEIDNSLKIEQAYALNGLIIHLEDNRVFIFNASQNFVYIQKGTPVGEVNTHG